MATTLNLPYDRFVSQVTIGEPRPKANYLLMMTENLASLQRCEWTPAQNGSVVELPPHDFTRETFFADSYDAFKMGAAYDATNLTETAFAGMAAYRFKLPAAYLSGAQTLVGIEIPVQRDRALKSGLRIAAELSDSTTPSTDWAVVRGESGDLAEEAILSQSAVERYVDGRAAQDSVTISLAGADSTKRAYLWVYVTLEDYEDRWTRYNAKEARNYAIEGSAMISGDLAAVTFSADVAADGLGRELRLIGDLREYCDYPHSRAPELSPRYKRTVESLFFAHFNVENGTSWSSFTTPVRRAYGMFAQGGGTIEQVVGDPGSSTDVEECYPMGEFLLSSYYNGEQNAYKVTARITSASLMMSFATPKGWRATRFAIGHVTVPPNYSGYTDYGVINIWLARNKFLLAQPESILSDFRLYRPDVGSPPGWELIGVIDKAKLVATTTGTPQDMVFPLKAPLGGTTATIMMVPYVDMSAWTPPNDIFGVTNVPSASGSFRPTTAAQCGDFLINPRLLG